MCNKCTLQATVKFSLTVAWRLAVENGYAAVMGARAFMVRRIGIAPIVAERGVAVAIPSTGWRGRCGCRRSASAARGERLLCRAASGWQGRPGDVNVLNRNIGAQRSNRQAELGCGIKNDRIIVSVRLGCVRSVVLVHLSSSRGVVVTGLRCRGSTIIQGLRRGCARGYARLC